MWSRLLVVIAVLGVPATGLGSTVRYRTDAELVALSERVVHGRVLSVRGERSADGRVVYTVARLQVLEDFTGRPDAVIEVHELGGQVGASAMFVTGAARFAVGQEVIVCLERFGGDKWRSVAMSFSKFDVVRVGGVAVAALRQQGASVVGQTAADGAIRSPETFRDIVASVKGVRAVRHERAMRDAAAATASEAETTGEGPVYEGFTLLGGGMRWNQVDSGQPIVWYKNSEAPAPVVSGNGDAEIASSLAAWTMPTSANLTLSYGGTRTLGGLSPYCTAVNAGAGLITFEDPTNEIGSGVLAIGGGCSTSAGAKTVNGHYFSSFSHGFVVFNNAAQLGVTYTSSTNFARVLTHEIGHAIGLGHTPSGEPNATTNIMYPSCCYASTPLPPALGADDLAGLAFIYPAPGGGNGTGTCSFTVSPTSLQTGSAAGSATVAVTTGASCSWSAASQTGWLAVVTGASGTGSGNVTVSYAANGSNVRSGTLQVAGTTVTVTQQAASQAPAPCTYTVTPTSATLGATGGSVSLAVSTTSSCGWTATGGASWLGIKSGWTGVGPGTVGVTAGANTGPARAATLNVAGQVVALSQLPLDTDGDGLPDYWELQFGLDPQSAAGLDGGSGDPDGDGRSNIEEYQASTHPRGFHTRYLAEGAESGFFSTSIALGNPGASTARVQLRFLTTNQASTSTVLLVPAQRQRTVFARDVAGLTGTSFSTVVESDEPMVVDRRMEWDATGYGSHAETAVAAPSGEWYLAEGATHSGFELFYLLQNPGDSAATVEVTYLLPAPEPPLVRTYQVAARSRFNIWVDQQDARLAGTDVSAAIRVISGPAIIVERSMYLYAGGQVFGAGHNSAGVTAPDTRWLLAEGATGPMFDTFVLMANPGDSAATVEARYLLPGGAVVTRTYTVAPRSRRTVWVDLVAPALADTTVSAELVSTNAVPIIVERAMWWPGPTSASWREAHASPGVVASATDWMVADGELGGSRQVETYLLVANTGGTAGQVRVTLLPEQQAPIERVFTVPARSRFTVDVRARFPELGDRRFGARVTSLTPGVELVVERAVYSDAAGARWAAGSSALATPLP